MILFLSFSSFFFLFLVAEFIKRYLKVHPELTRKFVHIISGIGVIFWSYYLNQLQFLRLTFLFLILFLFFYKFKIFKSISLESRKTYGEITYLLGLLWLGFNIYQRNNLFVLGVLILMVPDAAAGIISFIIKNDRKNLIHFGVYSIVAYLVLIHFFPWDFSIIFAILLGITELNSPLGFDNITVPVIYTAFISILRL